MVDLDPLGGSHAVERLTDWLSLAHRQAAGAGAP